MTTYHGGHPVPSILEQLTGRAHIARQEGRDTVELTEAEHAELGKALGRRIDMILGLPIRVIPGRDPEPFDDAREATELLTDMALGDSVIPRIDGLDHDTAHGVIAYLLGMLWGAITEKADSVGATPGEFVAVCRASLGMGQR